MSFIKSIWRRIRFAFAGKSGTAGNPRSNRSRRDGHVREPIWPTPAQLTGIILPRAIWTAIVLIAIPVLLFVLFYFAPDDSGWREEIFSTAARFLKESHDWWLLDAIGWGFAGYAGFYAVRRWRRRDLTDERTVYFGILLFLALAFWAARPAYIGGLAVLVAALASAVRVYRRHGLVPASWTLVAMGAAIVATGMAIQAFIHL